VFGLQSRAAELFVRGAPTIGPGASQREDVNALLGDVNHQLLPITSELEDKTEDPEPAQNDTDLVAISITWPLNDTVLPVGDVALVFERYGFPSRDIPIEVSERSCAKVA